MITAAAAVAVAVVAQWQTSEASPTFSCIDVSVKFNEVEKLEGN